MDIEKLSRYAEGAYFSILLGHALDPQFIEHDIRERYYHPRVKHLVNALDYSVIVETQNKIIIAFAGTKNTLGWTENFFAIPTSSGLHYGFDLMFRKYKEEEIGRYLSGSSLKKPVVCYGYSQGGAVQGRANLFCREILHKGDVEGYSFCGPTWTTSKGLKRLRAARMRQTELYGDMDIVDDVGELVGGKHYGYRVKLPPVGTNFYDGHYYSNFCVAMQKLMCQWGKKAEMEFLESIAGLCTI